MTLAAGLLTASACRDLTGPNYKGEAIAYLSLDPKAPSMVVIAPDSRTLARYPLAFVPYDARLSPDRTRIALNDAASKLWIVDLRDRRSANILQGAGSLDWSSDSQHLLFDNNYAHDEAWVVNVDGSAPHAVSHDSLEFAPVWSPDGSHIAYDSRRDDGANSGHYRLYIMNADGTGTYEVPIPVLNASDDMGRPAWSPDGRALAFERFGPSSTTVAIWVANVDGTAARQLTQGGAPTMPSWSRDGKTIAYLDTAGTRSHVFTIDVQSGRVTQVGSSSAGEYRPHWVQWP